MSKITCKVCGKEYDYCNNCPKYADKPSWYALVCSDNCKEIFDTLRESFLKVITKNEAKKKLSKLDISKKDMFKESVRKQIDEIMNSEKEEKELMHVEEVIIPEIQVVPEEIKETKEKELSHQEVLEETVDEIVPIEEKIEADEITDEIKPFKKKYRK